MDVKELLVAVASSGLATWINTTRGAFAVVEALHVIAITTVFGTILVVDLRLLGLLTTTRPFTEVAAETLRWTWAAFGLAAITGSLLFTTNPVFYFGNFESRTKMVLMLLAGINMAVFELRTMKTVALWDVDKSPPAAARLAGALSLALWLGVITFGRLIGFAASAMQDPFANL
jgi:uncharacterized protein DUF6644